MALCDGAIERFLSCTCAHDICLNDNHLSNCVWGILNDKDSGSAQTAGAGRAAYAG